MLLIIYLNEKKMKGKKANKKNKLWFFKNSMK